MEFSGFSKYIYNLFLKMLIKRLTEPFGHASELNSDYWVCLVTCFEAYVARWCDNATIGHPW